MRCKIAGGLVSCAYLLVIVWGSCMFLGCDVEKSQTDTKTVQGILTDLVVMHEDNGNITTLVKFEDGRIQKLRMNWAETFCFQTGKMNIIQYDAWGTIQKVEIK
jgi:hypothetical protein